MRVIPDLIKYLKNINLYNNPLCGQKIVNTIFEDNNYISVKNSFILKMDDNRPILYPLDYINTQISFLQPIDGFALSLLNGKRKYSEIKKIFKELFTTVQERSIDSIYYSLDKSIRNNPSQVGIGTDGLFDISDKPVTNAQAFDSREFIINSSLHMSKLNDLKFGRRLTNPVNVYTIYTHKCLVDCRYCYADRSVKEEMSLSKWKEIIKEIKSLGIWLCSPDNGDTFARRDGIDFLEVLLENEMHFLLSTKALVNKEQVARLIKAGFKDKVRGAVERHVQLSIDAGEEVVAQRLLNTKLSPVQRAVESFDNFYNAGLMPKIKAVITGINYSQPLSIVKKFYPRGARTFNFVRYNRSFHKHSDDLFINENHISELKKQFDEIRSQYSDVYFTENIVPESDRQPALDKETIKNLWNNRIGCGGGWSALGIAANGKAFLCEQMKMEDKYFVGDVNTQSISDIWNSDKLLNFIYPSREQFTDTQCETCTEFETCMWKQGRCYRDAFFNYGSIYQTPPLCPKNDKPRLRIS